MNQAKDFVDFVGPHELAHQWWGHQVGWKTYHDVWLSEGFAEFTAGLVVQQTKGNNALNKFYENKRKYILERSFQSTITNDKAGPISQGYRINTWQDPSAYRTALGLATGFLANRDFDSASRTFDAARARTHDKDEQRFITIALTDLATIKVR